MLHFKFNPLVRAIGTVGAVAGLVGGITFAATGITTTPVTLSNNTLTSATASLAIGANNSCPAGGTTSVPGMNFNNLLPGVASSPFPFCVDNTGNTPLSITASTPTSFSGSAIDPANVSLHFTCGVGGAATGAVDVTTTVAGLESSGIAFGSNPLNNGTNNTYTCNVTATLNSSVTTSHAALTPFDINFVGTSGGSV